MKKALLLSFCFFASKASDSPVKCAYFNEEIDPRLYNGPIIVRDVLAPENLVVHDNQRPKELSPFENAFFYVESKVPKSFPRNNISEILISWDENQLSNFNILDKLIASIIATERGNPVYSNNAATSSNLGNQSLSQLFGKAKSPVSKSSLDLIKELESIYGPCKDYIESMFRQFNLPLNGLFDSEDTYHAWVDLFKKNISMQTVPFFVLDKIRKYLPDYDNIGKIKEKISKLQVDDRINTEILNAITTALIEEEFPE